MMANAVPPGYFLLGIKFETMSCRRQEAHPPPAVGQVSSRKLVYLKTMLNQVCVELIQSRVGIDLETHKVHASRVGFSQNDRVLLALCPAFEKHPITLSMSFKQPHALLVMGDRLIHVQNTDLNVSCSHHTFLHSLIIPVSIILFPLDIFERHHPHIAAGKNPA